LYEKVYLISVKALSQKPSGSTSIKDVSLYTIHGHPLKIVFQKVHCKSYLTSTQVHVFDRADDQLNY